MAIRDEIHDALAEANAGSEEGGDQHAILVLDAYDAEVRERVVLLLRGEVAQAESDSDEAWRATGRRDGAASTARRDAFRSRRNN